MLCPSTIYFVGFNDKQCTCKGLTDISTTTEVPKIGTRRCQGISVEGIKHRSDRPPQVYSATSLGTRRPGGFYSLTPYQMTKSDTCRDHRRVEHHYCIMYIMYSRYLIYIKYKTNNPLSIIHLAVSDSLFLSLDIVIFAKLLL